MEKKLISETQFYDPRISRIHKIMPKIRPKYIDLYASIYGKLIKKLSMNILESEKLTCFSFQKISFACA